MTLLGSSTFMFPARMFPSEWQKPFNISIGLHILVLVIAMLAPTFFQRQPKLPEIYTVNLFTATEVAEPKTPPVKAPAPKTAAKQKVVKTLPEPKKPAISVKPARPVADAVVKTPIAKPVSLKPRKLKVKVGKTREETAVDRAKLSKVVQQLQAGAAQKEAREEADRAAKTAVSKLADAIRTSTAVTGDTAAKTGAQSTETTKTAAVSGPRGTGIEPDFYMKQYLSAVHQKIKEHWVLPDLQNWDKSVRAVLVITARRDGIITDSFFEQKSKNIYFNQFILKTVKDASPLPPFPDQLKQNTYEIGLRFSPEGLY
ncbi:MAG: TonB C-terminal domain-containing protein [Desulfobulbales bacterium]|nr:TonB C-terminal domain-containing protein [Desulfobulbales bacterium]